MKLNKNNFGRSYNQFKVGEKEENERLLKEAEKNEKEEKKIKTEAKKMMEKEKEEYIEKMTKKGATLPRGYIQN